jgi:hypothetical protein
MPLSGETLTFNWGLTVAPDSVATWSYNITNFAVSCHL